MEEIRIIVSSDPTQMKSTIDQLEKVGKVDKDNADKFKKHSEEKRKLINEGVDLNTKLTRSFEELGQGIVAAFAVEKIIEWGKECLEAFGEAEKATNELRFAVTNLAGGDNSAFNELIEQSENLSASLNNLFSPKQIQQSQTMLLRMKLNTEQVAQIMPRLADIAAKTGKDLNSVAEGFGRAISEGNTKALTEFGLKFKDTGTLVGNFNKVMETSAKYIGGAADAMNDFSNQQKEAANKAEILQEQIGAKLAPVWIGLKNEILGGTSALIDFFIELKKGLTGENFNWKEASKDLANALGYLFTAGLVHFKTTAEQMAEYQKMSYNMLLKSYVDLKHELDAATKKGDLDEQLAINEKLRVISTLVQQHNKKEIAEQANFDKDLRHNKELANSMSIEALKKYQQEVLKNEQLFSVTGFEQEKSAIEAALKRSEEEGKKKLDAKKKQLEKEAQMMADFEKKAIEEMIKEDNEKLKLDEEFNSLINKRQEQINEAQLESDKLALKKKFDNKKITQEEYEKELRHLENENRIKNAQFELDSIKEIQKEKKTFLKNERINNIISEDEYNKELLKLQVEEGDAELKLQKAINAEKFDINKKSNEKTKELLEALKESVEQFMEYIVQRGENNIAIIDAQAERQDKMIETQKVLAEKGLANDLAFEEKRADELTKKKMDEERKLKRIKEFETFLNSLAKFSEDDPKTALPKALGILAAARAAEAVFAEEGGIIGQTTGKSVIGLNGFSRRHRSGNDVLLHAEKGEGILSVHEMNNLGHQNFGILKNILKTPFHEKLIPNSRPMVINDHSEVVRRLESLEHTILNKKETQYDFVGQDLRITEIENGMKKMTIVKRNRI